MRVQISRLISTQGLHWIHWVGFWSSINSKRWPWALSQALPELKVAGSRERPAPSPTHTTQPLLRKDRTWREIMGRNHACVQVFCTRASRSFWQQLSSGLSLCVYQIYWAGKKRPFHYISYLHYPAWSHTLRASLSKSFVVEINRANFVKTSVDWLPPLSRSTAMGLEAQESALEQVLLVILAQGKHCKTGLCLAARACIDTWNEVTR